MQDFKNKLQLKLVMKQKQKQKYIEELKQAESESIIKTKASNKHILQKY